ncbi:MAG: tetratricopeptide repeat protein [Desulfobacterales bacterium]|jgi:cytochrome c-type biogenesis protein CcmH/NrfG
MARQLKIIEGNYVRKETFLMVTLLALAVGFFGGVVFAVFKSDSKIPGQSAPMPPPQAAAPVDSDRIAALERQTRDNPGNTQAWTALGNAYFDSDQYEKSISAYRKSLELDPSNPNVWTDMGVMYRRSGKPEEAIKAFDQAIAADPKHEVSRMNKGIVLLHDLNDFDGAIRAWEGLLEVNPIATAPNGISIDSMVVQLKKQQAGQGPKSQ